MELPLHCPWARQTSPENPKNPEKSWFWSFLGPFFLINYIGFWWFSEIFQIFKIDFLVDQKIFVVQKFLFDLIYISSVTENHLEHRQVKSHTRVTQFSKKSPFFVLIDIFWPPTWWILCTGKETDFLQILDILKNQRFRSEICKIQVDWLDLALI